jgi:hypothetical protein
VNYQISELLFFYFTVFDFPVFFATGGGGGGASSSESDSSSSSSSFEITLFKSYQRIQHQ